MYTRAPLPGFAGIATFLRGPSATVMDLRPGQIAVVGLPWIAEAGRRPTATSAPRGVRESSSAFAAELEADPRHELVDIDSGRRVRFANPLPVVDLGDLAPSGRGPATLDAAIRELAHDIVVRQALPVFLGGGRAISAPLIAGCATGRRLAYVQLTRSLALATPGRRLDNAATVASILADGSVREEDVVWLGLYGYVPLTEWGRAQSGGGMLRTATDLTTEQGRSAARVAMRTVLDRCDAVYLTLDASVVDTGYVAGTSELQVGGLEPIQALTLAAELSDLPLVAIDLVEVAPGQDPSGRAERLGFELILQALGQRLAREPASVE
jgi:agmatinase